MTNRNERMELEKTHMQVRSMNHMKFGMLQIAVIALILAAAQPTQAEIIRVEIRGTVEFNVFVNGPLAQPAVQPGDVAVVAFYLDSTDYLDSPLPTCRTRGYRMLDGSFSLRIGDVDIAQVADLPANQRPYFLLRDNDPGVDGVLFANSQTICAQTDAPVPIDLPGASGAPFSLGFSRTFDDPNSPDTVFNSLNIEENEGYWGFEWMSSYDFGVNGGGGTPLGIVYDWFSITQLSPPEVTQPPAPTQACPGGDAEFTVETINASAFLWRQNGFPLVDGPDGNGGTVGGATTDTLMIQNIAVGHAGDYDCLVSNGANTDSPYDVATSATAALSFWASCTGGDMDCDGGVSAGDIPGFISAVLNPGGFTACNLLNGDANHDGHVDGRDVSPFVQCVLLGGCP